MKPGSTHEFAEELAAPLPTRMIAELLGDERVQSASAAE
jgi:hypothetical protein